MSRNEVIMYIESKNKLTNKQKKRKRRKRKKKYERERKQLCQLRVTMMRGRPTESETFLRDALDHFGIRHTFQYSVLKKSKFFILDFVIYRDDGIIFGVEIDGSSHQGERARKYDETRTELVRKWTGLSIIRFTNAEVSKSIEQVLHRINTFNPQNAGEN